MRERGRGEKLINLGYLALILSPFVILLLQSLFLKRNFFLGVPTWSDELDYFREMFSFSRNGFEFGGSMFVGHEAKIGPLGAHSFSPVVAWGLPALIGWNAHSILICNLVALSIAFGVLVLLVRPKGNNLLLILFAVYLYGPLLLYLHTSMMEVMIYAWSVVYFSLFYKYLKSERKLFFWLAVIAGIIVTLMRMPYVVMLFPLIWARTDYKINLKTIKNLAIYVLLFFAVYKVYNVFCADYPAWVTSRVGAAASVREKVYLLAHNTVSNLKRYFAFGATPAQVMLRYAYGFMIVFLGVAGFFEISGGKIKKRLRGDYLSLFVMLGGLWSIMIVLYDIKDYRDYRTFSIVLFFTLLYVFTDAKRDEGEKWPIYASASLCVLIFAFSFREGLTKDRVFANSVEIDSSFDKISYEKDGEPVSIGATWDINWGDISLQMSVPDSWGYKVFLEDEIDDMSKVQYVLTTESYLNEHPELIKKLEFVLKTDDLYEVYKVK